MQDIIKLSEPMDYLIFNIFALSVVCEIIAECRLWDINLWGGASGFWHTLSYIFSAYVVKILDPGHARSGHQVTSSDLTS